MRKNNIHEDDLLRPLFSKIGMKKAPDDLAGRIMEQILIDPEIKPSPKFHMEWWWPLTGLIVLVSLYFTGIFNFIGTIFSPYLYAIFEVFAGYAEPLADLLPANIIILPSSSLLIVIIPGILFILMMDLVFRQSRLATHE